MTAIEDTLPPVADDAPTELIDATVAEIAEMNGDGWAVFEENGVTDSTAVQLEFAFSAPNEHTAEDLAEYLQVTADYEASPGSPATESDEWTVTGTTPAVTVSPSGLDEWVRRMAAVGYEQGGCQFEGWAAILD
ncbi:MAG: hypothetical protein QOE37_994 [Microbacteriaceae bacterium]|jgi:hypothetical protein|nr:hypothetical protein [Microbacteriaceae bacterium]